MENKKIITVAHFFFICFLLFSCNNIEKNNNTNNDTIVNKDISVINIVSPKPLSLFTIGDKIEIKANVTTESAPDSSFILLNNKVVITNFRSAKNTINTDSCHTGNNNIQIIVWNNGKQDISNVSILLKSNVVPEKFSYKVIKAFPHNSKSYTQGLVYENGFMYEGTGQYGESDLQKYKLQNSELIQSYNLPEDVFGEGIVIYKNKIYQLTWQSQIAFELDKSTFKLINKFNFNTEGWGITNLDGNLIMSDGSNTLYVLNPETFSEIKKIEVYDNIGPVNQLNELELIDGKIYANVYQTDNIVIIEPQTGKVIGKINCNGLLDKSKVTKEVDVLNGIAWDQQNRKLFLTGKWWPQIYEVQIVKQ